jgi:hypothetical protein
MHTKGRGGSGRLEHSGDVGQTRVWVGDGLVGWRSGGATGWQSTGFVGRPMGRVARKGSSEMGWLGKMRKGDVSVFFSFSIL